MQPLAAPIEAPLDALAAAIEPRGACGMPVGGGASSAPIQPSVDAVAPAFQSVFDTLTGVGLGHG